MWWGLLLPYMWYRDLNKSLIISKKKKNLNMDPFFRLKPNFWIHIVTRKFRKRKKQKNNEYQFQKKSLKRAYILQSLHISILFLKIHPQIWVRGSGYASYIPIKKKYLSTPTTFDSLPLPPGKRFFLVLHSFN